MKTHVKKRNYRAHCRAQQIAGLVNEASTGDWKFPSALKVERMSAHTQKCILAGAMGKNYKGVNR